MRSFMFRTHIMAWFLAFTAMLLMTACGGGKDPILGGGGGTALVPGVSATVPLARDPAVTGVAINARVTATFNKAMSPNSLNTDTFLLTCPAGTAIAGSVTYDVASHIATFAPDADLPSTTRCVATITTDARDTMGIPLPNAFVWAFETGALMDTTSPTVISQVPAQGAVAVINAPVTATFSEDMAPDSIHASSFTLKTTLDGVPVIGAVTYAAGARTATFTPTSPAPLPANTSFTATVSTVVADLAGNPMTVSKVWTFTTAALSDTIAPEVISQVPAQGAVIAINSPVTATFSEDMAADSIHTGSFTLKTTLGDSPIVGTVTYVPSARTATFTPLTPSPLPNDTAFTATVSTGATDLAGNPLAVNKVWTFATAALSDTTAPYVSAINPVDGALAVCTNKAVNVSFSEAMDPLSMNASTLMLAPTANLAAPVLAVVTYDAVTHIATVTSAASLEPSTAYTATVLGGSMGVKDIAGNPMVADRVWQFTTGTSQCQTPVVLGASSGFAILASAAITNIPSSTITGDVGLTPDTGANITGFSSPASCPEVTGHVYAVNSAGPACALIDAVLLSNAKTDALAAFLNATGAARGTPTSVSTNLAGLTFYPGLYESLTTLDLSPGGVLTLDAQGDPNAVFVIRSATAINALSTSQVVLSGGARASRVFWTAGSAITLGVNAIMKGSMLAGTAITLQTGANLEGRALNQGAAAAAISCDACTITVPTP